MMDAMQRYVFENSIADPLWSALFAGYAIVANGEVFITPAGEKYLKSLE
jgi:hypothetical protein